RMKSPTSTGAEIHPLPIGGPCRKPAGGARRTNLPTSRAAIDWNQPARGPHAPVGHLCNQRPLAVRGWIRPVSHRSLRHGDIQIARVSTALLCRDDLHVVALAAANFLREQQLLFRDPPGPRRLAATASAPLPRLELTRYPIRSARLRWCTRSAIRPEKTPGSFS